MSKTRYEELREAVADADWALDAACEFGFDEGFKKGLERGKAIGRSALGYWLWAMPIFMILGIGVAWFMLVVAAKFGVM